MPVELRLVTAHPVFLLVPNRKLLLTSTAAIINNNTHNRFHSKFLMEAKSTMASLPSLSVCQLSLKPISPNKPNMLCQCSPYGPFNRFRAFLRTYLSLIRSLKLINTLKRHPIQGMAGACHKCPSIKPR
eukprot:TCALIF_06690-PA protein Name:"Protein of unknown function" AED:0.06 eAED:0.06 QI:260/1/0.66/1/0.5/0.33/3/0/128